MSEEVSFKASAHYYIPSFSINKEEQDSGNTECSPAYKRDLHSYLMHHLKRLHQPGNNRHLTTISNIFLAIASPCPFFRFHKDKHGINKRQNRKLLCHFHQAQSDILLDLPSRFCIDESSCYSYFVDQQS
jgi:hypothetical protein